jgi:hypothetical protein
MGALFIGVLGVVRSYSAVRDCPPCYAFHIRLAGPITTQIFRHRDLFQNSAPRNIIVRLDFEVDP